MNKDEVSIYQSSMIELCDEECYEIIAGDSKALESVINIKEFIDFIKNLLP